VAASATASFTAGCTSGSIRAFDAWIHEVDAYLWDRAKVMELRRRYLTPEQIIKSEAIENDP
jgi:hypothetical protein